MGEQIMIKILIVDENPVLQECVKVFLAADPETETIGVADTEQAALEKSRELHPDIVLLDLKVGDMNGLNTTGRLKKELPKLHVIVLGRYDFGACRDAAESVGASAYLAKKDLVDELQPTIRRVVSMRVTAS